MGRIPSTMTVKTISIISAVPTADLSLSFRGFEVKTVKPVSGASHRLINNISKFFRH